VYHFHSDTHQTATLARGRAPDDASPATRAWVDLADINEAGALIGGQRVPVHAPHRALLEQRRTGLRAAAAAAAAAAGAAGAAAGRF
jgi:hypothetical protein